MDNQNTNGLPQDDSWLDELLTSPELGDELGPDESAVTSAGLTHPDDAELERIIQETKVVGWDEALASALGAPLEDIPQEGPSIPETVPFQDEEYRDTFGDGEALASLFGGETPPPGEVPEAPEEEDEPAPLCARAAPGGKGLRPAGPAPSAGFPCVGIHRRAHRPFSGPPALGLHGGYDGFRPSGKRGGGHHHRQGRS